MSKSSWEQEHGDETSVKALTTDYNLPTENGPVLIVHCVMKDDSLPGEREIYITSARKQRILMIAHQLKRLPERVE